MEKNRKNWILKRDSSLTISENEAVRSWNSNRKFTGKKGDFVILLEYFSRIWVFSRFCTIKSVELGKDQVEGEKGRIIVRLDLGMEFGMLKPLENFKFSLLAVKNYSNPAKHFRTWKEITIEELNAILFDNVDLKRSLLGFTFYEMHLEHRKAFLNFLGLSDFSQDYIVHDLEKILIKLNDYVVDSIINPGHQFLEGVKLFKEMFGNEIYSNLSIADHENSVRVTYAVDQEEVLKKYLNNLEQYFGSAFINSKNEYSNRDEYYRKSLKSPIVLKIN
ncbi:hypothetical protein SAMN04488104_102515 [Algoriphagus faecimaris]|uniref:Uncharacterized protein n=1 Tax=Algoriphagus faecimaris TaxID=686796 RepID=A0A1G6TYC2_9BACT|nr:hypothetical protein [Algoriphagus faecimaris]SDD34063.1 hypothetical protein SAMN04488104_102515 [Algoriphagus faecimaris]